MIARHMQDYLISDDHHDVVFNQPLTNFMGIEVVTMIIVESSSEKFSVNYKDSAREQYN